jgi:hypothetical protein
LNLSYTKCNKDGWAEALAWQEFYFVMAAANSKAWLIFSGNGLKPAKKGRGLFIPGLKAGVIYRR